MYYLVKFFIFRTNARGMKIKINEQNIIEARTLQDAIRRFNQNNKDEGFERYSVKFMKVTEKEVQYWEDAGLNYKILYDKD